MICPCHLPYLKVFKIRQGVEITVSLVGALGTASCCYFLFTASDRAGQGGGFKGKAAKLGLTALRVFPHCSDVTAMTSSWKLEQSWDCQSLY